MSNYGYISSLRLLTFVSAEQWKPQDYNDGYKQWAADHGDDPDAAADLLAEHAALSASEDKKLTSTDIEKRVSRIGVQFAEMVRYCSISGVRHSDSQTGE